MNKVLIAMPCLDSIKSKTAYSLFNLRRNDDWRLVMQNGCDIAHNRNQLVDIAINEDYTHILFIDSDMQFNPDTLDKMLEHNTDIIGLLCHQRKLPPVAVFMPLEQEGNTKDEVVDFVLPKELFEVLWVGTGILLIKVDVFKKLEKPFFEFGYDGRRIGEDVYFCRKAREAGFKIMVDPTLATRHIGEYAY